jgi:hypothetical protein
LEQVLAPDPEKPWAESRVLLACFALSRPERWFARRLLERKRNLWLFRCNQRALCGDFIVVDMSARTPKLRVTVVVELKSRVELVLGGGGAGNQFQNTSAALDELAKAKHVTAGETPVTLACGDPHGVLAWIVTGASVT